MKMIGPPCERVVEESVETLREQMTALENGTIPVMMIPQGGTSPFADLRHDLRSIEVKGDGGGAGLYFFNPQKVKVAYILEHANEGAHARLLGHAFPKEYLKGKKTVVLQAHIMGVVAQDSVTLDEEDAIEAQAANMKERFPGCVVVIKDNVIDVLQERLKSRGEKPSMLLAFKQDEYRIGNLQALGYLRTNTETFPEGYLGRLYHQMRVGRSGKPGYSWLKALMCGASDLSFDATVSYLASRPLCVMGQWDEDAVDVDGNQRAPQLATAGIIFPSVERGRGDVKATFAGYGFFRPYWRTEEQKTLAMLGIAFMFVEMNLVALHGVRYADNHLTVNFLADFGFRDTGVLEKHLYRDGELVDAIPSTLLREDFEAYCERWAVATYGAQEAFEE